MQHPSWNGMFWYRWHVLLLISYPNEHSKESPFFLMFGRDPVLPLNTLLGPNIRYLGNDINILSLEAMKNTFEIAATNLQNAREQGDPKDNIMPSTLQPGDTVLVIIIPKDPLILSI